MRQLWYLLLGMHACAGGFAADEDVEKLKAAWAQAKAGECEPTFGQTSVSSGISLTPVSCASPKGTEGKAGLLVWEGGEKPKYVWHRLRPGPLPHHFAWIDFDDDKAPDLFALSGQEDVAWTEVYASKGKSFRQIHYSDKEYGVVVDADRDDQPDIFLAMKREEESDPCSGLEFPPSLASQIKDKYLSISNHYKEANYTYDMPEDFPLINMYMLQKVQILKFSKRSQKMTDETTRFQDHIAWRITMLERLLKTKEKIKWASETSSHEACYREIGSIISYWKSRVITRKAKQKARRKRS